MGHRQVRPEALLWPQAVARAVHSSQAVPVAQVEIPALVVRWVSAAPVLLRLLEAAAAVAEGFMAAVAARQEPP